MRGITFLKQNEELCNNTNDYNKNKILQLSDRLGTGQIKQVRAANKLINLFLSEKENIKHKFRTQLKHVKDKR